MVKQFSCFSKSHGSLSRIDLEVGNSARFPSVLEVSYKPRCISDHSYMVVCFTVAPLSTLSKALRQLFRGVGRMLLPFELRMGTRQGCPLSLLLGDMEQSLKETMDTIVFFREVFWLQNNKSPLMPLDEDLWQHGDSVGDIPIVTSFLYLGIWVTP